MTASVVTRVQADVVIRLAPEGPGGVRARRSGATDAEPRRHERTDGAATHADRVAGETHGAGGEPDPRIVSRRSEFELDMPATPGFVSEWSFE